MFKKNLIFLVISSFIFSAIYSVGDIVSVSHQNQPFDVCYGEHPEDNLKLVHFNGAENGGVYKVMLIDISATWCAPCVQFIPDFDAIDNNWADNDGVEIFNALGDMNQPYSCTQWGNMGIPNIPMIAHDAQNNIFSWFNTGNAIPSTVFIDHEMRVHYMSNQVSYSQANNIIQSMLDNCTMCGNPDYDNDFVLNEEDNCPNDFNPNQEDQDMDQIGDTCDDCHNLSGDPNDDMFVTVTDIILVVSMISNGGYDSPSHSECQKSDGNFNNDSVINVLDIIQMINIILGNTVSTNSLPTEGIANIDISNYNNKLTLTFSSEEDILGIQINSNLNTSSAKLIDNSEKEFITNNNVILSYSLNNSPFNNNFKIEIDSPDRSEVSDFDFIISDKGGNSMNLVFSENGNIFSESDFKFELGNTYPNPFNPTTDINFSLPMDGNVSLDAYNLQGQKIENIFSGYQIKGSHNYTWDASHLTSGIYYIKLVSGVHQATTRTILMK